MLKRTKKILALGLSCMMMIASAAGCGSTQSQPADQPAAQTAETQQNPSAEPTGQDETKDSAEEGLHKLTQQDILDIYDPVVKAEYKDDSMSEAVKSGTGADLELTEE